MKYRQDRDQLANQRDIDKGSSIGAIILSFPICLLIAFLFWIFDFVVVLFT